MNFDPEISTGTAVVMAMAAAAMWGTWPLSLKYLRGYTLDGYFLTIFVTSLVFVWTIGWLIDGAGLVRNFREIWV